MRQLSVQVISIFFGIMPFNSGIGYGAAEEGIRGAQLRALKCPLKNAAIISSKLSNDCITVFAAGRCEGSHRSFLQSSP